MIRHIVVFKLRTDILYIPKNVDLKLRKHNFRLLFSIFIFKYFVTNFRGRLVTTYTTFCKEIHFPTLKLVSIKLDKGEQ